MMRTSGGKPVSVRRSRASAGILSVAAVALVYLLTLAILPRDGFWINDNGCKFIQTRSLIETGYRDFSIPWPGLEVDPEYTCNPLPSPFGHLVADRLFGTFSPVFPLLSAVLFGWLGYPGLYLLPLMGGLATLAGVWSLVGLLPSSGRVRRLAQPLCVGLVGLATPIWFYSVTFWEHMPAVACTTWAVRSCVAAREGQPLRNLIMAGCLLALAVWFRDDCYLLAIVLPFVLGWKGAGRVLRLATFAAAFALALTPLWLFQWEVLGAPLGFHLRAGSVFEIGLWNHLRDRIDVAALLLLNNHPSQWLSAFVSLVPLILLIWHPRLRAARFRVAVIVLCAVAIADGIIVLGGLVTADSPIWALPGSNGLFAASPILLIGFIRFERFRAARRGDHTRPPEHEIRGALVNMILAYAAVYVLLTPKAHAGGIHWGCRYLLPLMPVMGVLSASTIADWYVRFHTRARMGVVLASAAIATSIVAQLFSLTLLHSRKQYSSALNRLVLAAPEEVVIAEGWFVPQSLAGSFFEKKIFLAGRPGAAEGVIRRLRERGVDRVLSVAWTPEPTVSDPGTLLLDDGWLRFMTLRIESVNIAAD